MRKIMAEMNKISSPIVELSFETDIQEVAGLKMIGPGGRRTILKIQYPQLEANLKFINCTQDQIIRVLAAIQRTATPPKKKSRKKS